VSRETGPWEPVPIRMDETAFAVANAVPHVSPVHETKLSEPLRGRACARATRGSRGISGAPCEGGVGVERARRPGEVEVGVEVEVEVTVARPLGA